MSIAPENTFALLAVLLVLSALAAWTEKTAIGRRLSGVGFLLIGATAASHFGIIPRSAPLYDTIWTYLVPLAIALFLFKADLIRVFSEGGRVLVAFLIGSIGTAVGAIIGALVLDIGADEAKIAAVYAGTYIGGSLNFVAVAEAVKLDDPSRLAAALAIDNVLGVGYIVFANVVASWTLFHQKFPWRADGLAAATGPGEQEASRPFTLEGVLTTLAIAGGVVAIGVYAAQRTGIEGYALLYITVIMTALATLGRRVFAKSNGEDIVAMMFMYLFFAIIGASANINSMLTAAPSLFAIVLIIFIAHVAFMAAAGALLKLNYGELVIGSIAGITGPPVAAAIAILMGWRNLVVPGVLTGILGYVIGNFAGIGIFLFLGGRLQ